MKLLVDFAYELESGLKLPTLYSEQLLSEALWILIATDTHGLPVCNSQGYLEGFLSLSDIALRLPPTRVALDSLEPRTTYSVGVPNRTIAEVMTTNVVTAHPDDHVEQILELLLARHSISNRGKDYRKQHITSIPLVRNGKVTGIVSYIDLLRKIDVGETSIADVMATEDILLISATDTLKRAKALMDEFRSRYVLVVNDQKHKLPIGIISDFQIMRHMQTEHHFSELLVEIAMTDLACFVQISPEDSVQKVLPILANPTFALRAFPVVSGKQLRGTISYLDILRKLWQELTKNSNRPALAV
jgi:CBS domain-containing protein